MNAKLAQMIAFSENPLVHNFIATRVQGITAITPEDVIQDVLLKMSYSNMQGVENPIAFLMTCITNRIRDITKSANRRGVFQTSYLLDLAGDTELDCLPLLQYQEEGYDGIEEEQQLGDLAIARNKLNPEDATVLELWSQGLSTREIAETMDFGSLSMTKMRILRAKKQLRLLMQELGY